MKTKVYQVDAFSTEKFKGNPALVCITDDWLDDELMQNIAMECNLSDTAFVVPSEEYFNIRWFTPKAEIDLCGHATLATAHVLFDELNYDSDTIHFKYANGEIFVQKTDGLIELNFPSNKPVIVEIPDGFSEAH